MKSKSLYPDFIPHHAEHPSIEDFKVIKSDTDNRGLGLVAKRDFKVGEVLAKFSGVMTHEVLLHTLQYTPDLHLHDPWFIGMLLHSCEPNTLLQMSQGRIICQKNIKKGDWLTMDYATTESKLYRQFKCECGSDNCRGWIAGYAETPAWKEADFEENASARKQND